MITQTLTFLPISVADPYGLDINDTAEHMSPCDDGGTVVLGISTGHEEAVIPIGGEPDVIWLNVSGRQLYCAIGKPGVTEILDTEKSVMDEKIAAKEGAHTFTFDNKRQTLRVLSKELSYGHI